MGLGKTLSMISLIATDLLVNRNDPSSLMGANAEESSGRTLIVVPPPRESIAGSFPPLLHGCFDELTIASPT